MILKTLGILLLLGIFVQLTIVNSNLTFLHKQLASIISYIENVEEDLYHEDDKQEYHI
jgi:hypothetical protein